MYLMQISHALKILSIIISFKYLIFGVDFMSSSHLCLLLRCSSLSTFLLFSNKLFNRKTEFEPRFSKRAFLLTGDRTRCVMNTLTVEMEIGDALDNEALLETATGMVHFKTK